MLEPVGYMAGAGEWVPPEASPEDVGTLMGLGEAGPKGVLASSLTVSLRWGCSSELGPETGGPQRPNRQLPSTWPEPATPQ